MNYQEVCENAKKYIKTCKVCPECNGRACSNQIPGPGAKGTGDTAARNYDKWKEIRLNMDTLHAHFKPDTGCELFGRHFAYPFFVGPIGAINQHFGDKYNDFTYNSIMVSACTEAGIAAFTGDGVNPAVVRLSCEAIHKAGGMGIPTIKPWNIENVAEKLQLVKESGAFAVAMDIDAAGLPFLRNFTPPAGSKSVDELGQIIASVNIPFIVKGIMTAQGALKAKQAGASAIVVSNHGGRVLDQCAATAEVLEEIVTAVDGSMKILVDGGIRSGADIFKALALGADGVLICRPFVAAVFGGEQEGVQLLINKLGDELEDAMSMCGAQTLANITVDMVKR